MLSATGRYLHPASDWRHPVPSVCQSLDQFNKVHFEIAVHHYEPDEDSMTNTEASRSRAISYTKILERNLVPLWNCHF